jgi:hypothetical protein
MHHTVAKLGEASVRLAGGAGLYGAYDTIRIRHNAHFGRVSRSAAPKRGIHQRLAPQSAIDRSARLAPRPAQLELGACGRAMRLLETRRDPTNRGIGSRFLRRSGKYVLLTART